MRRILVFLIAAITLFTSAVFATGEWKPYLDILVFSNPSEVGVKLQGCLERNFVNISVYENVVSPSALRERLQYNGYNIICLFGNVKGGGTLDIPTDIETMIEDRCNYGISGLLVSGDIIAPESNNPIIQKLVGAQLSDKVNASRTTIRVIDITEPMVADVAQSFDVYLGEIRKPILYPGTKLIAVTNAGVPVLTKRQIVSSKASYICLGANGQAAENIEICRIISNAMYECKGTGWLQPLEAPQNLRAIGGDSKVKLTWDKPKNMEGVLAYRVYRESEGEKPFSIHDFGLVNEYEFIDENVQNGKLYTYRVCSMNPNDKPVACSHYVQVRPDKTKIEVPAWPPVGGVADIIGSKYMVLGKTKPGSKVIIEYRTIPGGQSGRVAGKADENGDFAIPLDLPSGQSVEYYIIVQNELGQEVRIGPFTLIVRADKLVISFTVGSTKAYVYGLEWPEDISPPFITKAGRTMVPFRFIGERLGAQVDWEPKDKQVVKVTYKLQNAYIELFIGKKEAKVNGQLVTLDQEPLIQQGRTMVPVRFVSEFLGAKVDWIAQTKMVVITYPDPSKLTP